MKDIKLTEKEIQVLNKIDKGEIMSITDFPSSSNINFINYIKYDMTKGRYYLDEKGKKLLEQVNNKSTINQKFLQIPIKFHLGQTVYTIRKVKPENPCHICKSTGKIKYNKQNITCPECKGTGKIVPNKFINIVCDEEYNIKIIRPNVYVDGTIIIKYKIQSATNTLNRAEQNLFLTKEEAQKKCAELNNKRVLINISDIAIPDDFKNSTPIPGKILRKLDYYNRYSKFDKDIVLNKDNVLIDGYINYLICQLLHINTIKVVIKNISDTTKINHNTLEGEMCPF